MKSMCIRAFLGCAVLVSLFVSTATSQEPAYTHKEDVIYGRKYGIALTMDVFTPKKDANGAAVVWCVSGGFFSDHAWIQPGLPMYAEFLKRGYTVFAVVHGSQPKFTIPDILEDMHRALRYIRYHAQDYHIDPDRIGITGGSAGGHLSLMQGTAGKEGDPKAKDPVDRLPSGVQAVACFFPGTDLLNFGKAGVEALGSGPLKDFKAPFDFQEFDKKTKSFVLITDEKKRREIGRQISPIYHVTKNAAPTLIIHGDADKLVPIQQAEIMIAKLKEAGVPAELIVKKGADHGWPNMDKDTKTLADWFDKYLQDATAKNWDAWRFLVGDWVAEGSGEPGKGSGQLSFAFDLQEKVLVRKNHAEYPATAERPALTHEDLMVIYRDASGKRLRASYFDNEGHVIHYKPRFSPDGKTLTFLSDPSPSAPRFRLTYTKGEDETLGIKFEMSAPGKEDAFQTYLEGKARRKEASKSQAGGVKK